MTKASIESLAAASNPILFAYWVLQEKGLKESASALKKEISKVPKDTVFLPNYLHCRLL